MPIGEIDSAFAAAGDEIADCRAAGEGGFSGPTLKEPFVFEFCFLFLCFLASPASLPTNQVYQSLKLMNGP